MTPSVRELIVVANFGARLRVTPDGITSKIDGEALRELKKILDVEKVALTPLFGVSEDEMEERVASKREEFSVPAMRPSLYYRVEADDERLEYLAEQFRKSKLIDTAYIQPGAEPAMLKHTTSTRLDLDVHLLPANVGCDFKNDQPYLLPGEFGINLPAAWNTPGGRGKGITIVDVEGAWCRTHVDLIDRRVEHLGGVESRDPDFRNHGTAVLGLLCGFGYGIRGICPDADVKTYSIFGSPSPAAPTPGGVSKAIVGAAARLSEGDVLLLEVHLPGPEANFKPNGTGRGYIAAEWWPNCLVAIKYATAIRGVVVVAAAGNGGVDLDSEVYNKKPPSFPTGWQNPFSPKGTDSEGILVGAGSPPNYHHSSRGPGRCRLNFSNYGCRVDVQSWGEEVTTTGYRVLCLPKEEFYYTTTFGGTSSASAIVSGAVACLQGIRKAGARPPLSSRYVRKILRDTGEKQTDFKGTPPRPKTQRIGNLPNLQQMIQAMP